LITRIDDISTQTPIWMLKDFRVPHSKTHTSTLTVCHDSMSHYRDSPITFPLSLRQPPPSVPCRF
jgi:hypothetical protein